MAKRNSTPIYMQVAVDVAARISREDIKKQAKISGRSTLAGEYNVSPETIRKAMRLLSDMDIVEVKHGNGIYVASVDRALEFIERYRIRSSVNELKDELIDLMQKREAIEDKMNETMNAIIDYTSRFNHSEHITVYEYSIDMASEVIGKSIQELDFWTNTGATIVGIKRDGNILLSPPGYEKICKDDKLLYVGEVTNSVRLGEFIRHYGLKQ